MIYIICLALLTVVIVPTGIFSIIEKIKSAKVDKSELLSIMYDCILKKIERFVNYENQTYVMNCKSCSDDGGLTFKESRMAFRSVMSNIINSLTPEETKVIEELFPGYDDIEDIIKILIESVVYENRSCCLVESTLQDTTDEDDEDCDGEINTDISTTDSDN